MSAIPSSGCITLRSSAGFSVTTTSSVGRRTTGVSTEGGRLVSLVPCQTAADQSAHRVPLGDGVFMATHPPLGRAGALHIPSLGGLPESGWAAGHPESALGAGARTSYSGD